jgi:CheY-like chemotaxis protein
MSCQVVVVDDDESVREAVSWLLTDEGHVVLRAQDGGQALALLRASSHPMVVVLDYKMPGLSGYGILSSATRDPRLAAHAFVLLTAFGDSLPPHVISIVQSLDVPVLPKPVEADRLVRAVEAACGHLGA